MYLKSQILIRFALAASILLGGFVSATHFHVPTDSGPEISANVACSCLFHRSQENNDGTPENNSESEDCLICHLLADFNSHCTPTLEIELDSKISSVYAIVQEDAICRTIRRFQGRAPPAV